MSRRLVVPPGSDTDAHGTPWAQVAADNGCDGVEESGSQWCLDNGIDGLGICTERPPPPPPPPTPPPDPIAEVLPALARIAADDATTQDEKVAAIIDTLAQAAVA